MYTNQVADFGNSRLTSQSDRDRHSVDNIAPATAPSSAASVTSVFSSLHPQALHQRRTHGPTTVQQTSFDGDDDRNNNASALSPSSAHVAPPGTDGTASRRTMTLGVGTLLWMAPELLSGETRYTRVRVV